MFDAIRRAVGKNPPTDDNGGQKKREKENAAFVPPSERVTRLPNDSANAGGAAFVPPSERVTRLPNDSAHAGGAAFVPPSERVTRLPNDSTNAGGAAFVPPSERVTRLPNNNAAASASDEFSQETDAAWSDGGDVTAYAARLWQYRPVPRDEPEPAPEYTCVDLRFAGSAVTAASVRGKQHKHEGLNNDDWFEAADCGGITFAAVADGAGSRKFSRIGAREACKAAVRCLVDTFSDRQSALPDLQARLARPLTAPACVSACEAVAQTVQQAVIKAHEAVEAAFYARKVSPDYDISAERGLELADFSTTLLVTAVIPVNEATGERLAVSCQVGDGVTALLNTKAAFEDAVKLIGVPDSGEFSGETRFLTSPRMKSTEALRRRTKISKGFFDTVLMMTDGVSDDYFPHQTEMHRLYFDLIANGILASPQARVDPWALTPRQRELLALIPAPTACPWVNDRRITVALNDTRQLMQATGLTLEELWRDPTAPELARLNLGQRPNDGGSPAERLKIWLDNYTERGSFDDRTLLIITM